jgi:putative ABC transport system permease protein
MACPTASVATRRQVTVCGAGPLCHSKTGNFRSEKCVVVFVLRNFRYAARGIARAPGFALAPVLTLALGIGANTAVFTLLNAYVLRPLPYGDPDRLAFVWQVQNPARRVTRSATAADFLAWRERKDTVEQIAAFRNVSYNLTGQDAPEAVRGLRVTDAFFRTLQARPALGRDFLPEEFQPGRDRVTILRDALWRGRFAARPDILGRTISLGGNSYTVVGVMPPGFRFPSPDCRLWTPLAFGTDRREMGVAVMVRLKPGVSMRVAGAEFASVSRALEDPATAGNAPWNVTLRTLHDALNHVREASPFLMVLVAAVVFVLLITCANVANLLLARGAARAREIAVRVALGAGRARLIWEMLAESLLLAVAGGAAGIVLGSLAIKGFLAAAPTWMMPLSNVEIDGSVLALTAIVSMLCGIAFGLAPAWQASKPLVAESLKESGRATTVRGGRLRETLVVSEVAAAIVLLIGAGLLLKSFERMQAADMGYRTQDLLTFDLVLSSARYAQPYQKADAMTWIEDRLARLPGVSAAGAQQVVWARPVLVNGRPAPLPGEEVFAAGRAMTPGYLRALGLPLRSGRYFDARDQETAPPVAIVNETMAKRLWPVGSPIGALIRTGGAKPGPWMTVVGVVADERESALGSVPPEILLPHRQEPPTEMNFVVRSHGSLSALGPQIRKTIAEWDRDLPVSGLATMEQALSDRVAPHRTTTSLLSAFAIVALALAVIGVYGVISYAVTQRSRELALRAALGASRRDILRHVVGRGMITTGLGVAIGLAGALGTTRLLTAILYGVTPDDPGTFAVAPILLLIVALAASFIPAWRAAKIDPAAALR